MNSLSIESITTQKNHGYQAPLSAISTTGQYKIEQSSADGIVYITENGGPWTPISTGGGIGGTLNDAYHFAPAATPITVDSGPVQLNGAATSGTILGITQTLPAAGALTAIAIDLSAAGTAGAPATVNVNAVTIVGAFSSVAKTTGAALVSISSAYRNATAVSVRLKNKQALAGSAVVIGWSTVNYEGATASSTLTGQTHVVTIDAQANVIPGVNEVVALKILIPPTSNVASAGCFVDSSALGGYAYYAAVTPGSSAPVFGVRIDMGPNADTTSYAGFFNWSAAGGTAAGNGILNINTNMAALSGVLTYLDIGQDSGTLTLSAAVTGISIDLDTRFAGGAQTIIGILIDTAATSSANSVSMRLTGKTSSVGLEMVTGSTLAVSKPSEGRLRYNSGTQTFQVSLNGAAYIDLATTGSSGTVTLQNAYNNGPTVTVTDAIGAVAWNGTRVSGTVFSITDTATASGAVVGLSVDLSGITAGAQQVRVVSATGPTSVSTNTSSLYYGMWQAANGTGPAHGIVDLGSNATLTGGLTAVWADLTTGVTPGSQIVRLLAGVIPATTATDANAAAAIYIDSRATAQRLMDFSIAQTSGFVYYLRYNAAATLAGNMNVYYTDLTGINGGLTNYVQGYRIDTPASSNVNTVAYYCTAKHTAGDIFACDYTAATLSGVTTGLRLNFNSAVFGTQTVNGVSIAFPSTGTVASAAVGILFTRTGSLGTGSNFTGNGLSIINTPARAAGAATEAGVLASILHAPTTGGAGALTDTTTGFAITMNPFSSSIVNGQKITMGPNMSASGHALDVAFQSTLGATSGVVRIALDGNVTQANITQMLNISSKTATWIVSPSLTGISIDLSTNISAGTNILVGMNINMGATSSTTARGITISTAYTGAGATGISISMTPGSAAAVVGAQITMGANSSGAAISVTHGGSGTNANHQIFTAAADGTGAHLRGPVSGTFVIKANNITGTANGNGVTITAGPGSTTGAGGGITLTAGAVAGANQNGGDISLVPTVASGAGVRGLVNFLNSVDAISGAVGPATLALTTGGATGPTTAAQQSWLVFKDNGTIKWVPAFV